MDNNTTNLKHITPTTPDRLVHSSLLGKLFAEITIASIYNPDNEAVAALKKITDEMKADLKEWRTAPVHLDGEPRYRQSADSARMMDETEAMGDGGFSVLLDRTRT